ncbi:hypothetical protein SAY87_032344 [Trapa incisa]|uniref:RNA helicase n=1 Tax=Trapa incisa TaxID=236973 RepID=A0AAN7GJB7_9MYRT|nr:hypothetical protein SAY87_032344 [Trapa incisa]
MGKKSHAKGDDRPVTEESGLRINRALQKFRSSKDEVYKFNEELSRFERAVVHKQCRKMGMLSKSSGSGMQRRVFVYKKKGHQLKRKRENEKYNENLAFVALSEQTKEALQELFTSYPPGDVARINEENGKNLEKYRARKRMKDDIFQKPILNNAEIVTKVESLSLKLEKAANLRKVTEQRFKLPIASFKNVILSAVESHQVVLVSGETGCGKTTQVPQYILDSMWAKEKTCKIICTQPRRISATSVAERICYERGEKIGDDIGYKIRLESKGDRNSSIVFCTNGVLLRVLIAGCSNKKGNLAESSKNVVSEFTHIIVDEIHERDRYSDFMLAILRDILPSHPRLRLILMSATIDVEKFSAYFGGCPVVCVPGFTHPVKTFYLEDVLSILKSEQGNHINTSLFCLDEDIELMEDDKFALDDAINSAWISDDFDSLLRLVSSQRNPKVYNYQHSVTGMTPLMVFAGKGRTDDVCMLLSFGADFHLKSKSGATALEWAEHKNQKEASDLLRKHGENIHIHSLEEKQLVDKYLATANPEFVDVILIEKLLKKICEDSTDGAILVFLPGWDDINKTRDRLLASQFFTDPSKFIIIALHSMIPSADQKKVFTRPSPGCRKIILSTNIAETSITIDDVVYVIDSGRMKEKSYDPYNNVSTLQSSWVSKASAKQRQGRAGRCQPGICYHLYSKVRAASLPQFQEPEIKRVPVEEICLQVKMMDPHCKIEDFLMKTLDPPVPETMHNAILLLQDIGALSHDENLTPLGEKLGALPVHPSTSKMLLFSIMMNCLDPALTLACASDYRDPFTLPMLPNEKKRAAAAKSELASLYNGQGDHLAIIAAFECWKKAKDCGQERQFCSQYFVSSSTMGMLFGMRKQLERELLHNRFIPEDTSNLSKNARVPGIVHAVLVAGLYPMVGKLLPPARGKRLVQIANGEKVRLLRPPSANTAFSKITDQLLVVYDEITRGEGSGYIRNSTVIGPLPVLLLASDIAVAPADENGDRRSGDQSNEEDGDEYDSDENNEVEIAKDVSTRTTENMVMSSPDSSVTVVADGWLTFRSTSFDIAQIYCLREQLLEAMIFKVSNPSKILPPIVEAYVHSTAQALSYDGLTGIPPLAIVNEAETGEDGLMVSKDKKHSGSLKWIRNLMGGRNTKSPGRRDPNPPFKVNQDYFRGSKHFIHQRFPSDFSNGLPYQRHARPLASPVSQQRPPQGPSSVQTFIQQPLYSDFSNPELGPLSYGYSSSRPARPSASSVSQQRPAQVSSSAWHRKSSSKQSNGEAMQSTSSAPRKKSLPRDPSLVEFGSLFNGPYGIRGDSLKRSRGNVSGQI